MKISQDYGPQFDASDGTVGETKLGLRWVVMQEAGEGDDYSSSMFDARQGRYTFASRREADERARCIVAANDSDKLRQIVGRSLGAYQKMALFAAPMWCWPKHYDPVGPAPGQAPSRRHYISVIP